jgi:glycosyltransferase involved in cell wall biosynthesis
MKIVLLSTSDISGGAAIASSRMAVALRKQGHEVHQLVLFKKSKDAWVEAITGESWFTERLRDAQYFFTQKFLVKPGYQLSFNPWRGYDVSQHPLVQAADVIQLHWINHGFMGMRELKALFALQKPIFWHMHDYWAFTGGCHYPGNCRKFETGCGFCPALRKRAEKDVTARQLLAKKEIYGTNRPTLVGASAWLSKEAESSYLANYAEVAHVPNPIDTAFYAEKAEDSLRMRLGIKPGEKVLLFAAMNTADVRKGFKELTEALTYLKKSSDLPLHLVVAGKSSLPANLPYPASFLGPLNAAEMRAAYQAADVFVIPSLEENLPNTILESLASGTPVVGFDAGGIPEVVIDGKSGFLAKTGDSVQLGRAVAKALASEWPEDFGEVLSRFSELAVARSYFQLINRNQKRLQAKKPTL